MRRGRGRGPGPSHPGRPRPPRRPGHALTVRLGAHQQRHPLEPLHVGGGDVPGAPVVPLPILVERVDLHPPAGVRHGAAPASGLRAGPRPGPAPPPGRRWSEGGAGEQRGRSGAARGLDRAAFHGSRTARGRRGAAARALAASAPPPQQLPRRRRHLVTRVAPPFSAARGHGLPAQGLRRPAAATPHQGPPGGAGAARRGARSSAGERSRLSAGGAVNQRTPKTPFLFFFKHPPCVKGPVPTRGSVTNCNKRS